MLIKIAPLTSQLDNLKRKLSESQDRLSFCEAELTQLDLQVQQLKLNFQQKTSDAEILKIGLNKAQSTLKAAQSLIGKLSDEKIRWQEQIDQIDN